MRDKDWEISLEGIVAKYNSREIAWKIEETMKEPSVTKSNTSPRANISSANNG